MSTETLSETTPAAEVTEESLIADALAKDDGGTFDGGASRVVVALDTLTSAWATQVRAYLDTDNTLVLAVALAIVSTLRCAFTFNGRPDVNGKSRAYQLANGLLIARLAGVNATDAERTTLRNRLQRRITRTSNADGHVLTQGVVEHVLARDKVKVTKAQREALRTHRFASLAGETDEKVLAVVASVKEAFGAGTPNRGSDARCQYERTFEASNAPKQRNAVASDDTGNADALTNVATVANLATAAVSGNVKASETLRSMLHALFALRTVLATQPPAPDEASETLDLLALVSNLTFGMGADLAGEDLSGDNLTAYADAVDEATAMFVSESESESESE